MKRRTLLIGSTTASTISLKWPYYLLLMPLTGVTMNMLFKNGQTMLVANFGDVVI